MTELLLVSLPLFEPMLKGPWSAVIYEVVSTSETYCACFLYSFHGRFVLDVVYGHVHPRIRGMYRFDGDFESTGRVRDGNDSGDKGMPHAFSASRSMQFASS